MKAVFPTALAFVFCLALSAHAATAIQEDIVLWRFHFGLGVGDMAVGQDKMRAFIDDVLTPAFPNGMTITEARGQWRSEEHGLIRERTVLVDVQCPDTEANRAAVEAAAQTYVQRFQAAKASVFVVRQAPVTTTLYY